LAVGAVSSRRGRRLGFQRRSSASRRGLCFLLLCFAVHVLTTQKGKPTFRVLARWNDAERQACSMSRRDSRPQNTDNSIERSSLSSLCVLCVLCGGSSGSPKSPASCRRGLFGLYRHTSLRQCQGVLETRSMLGGPPGQKRKDRRSWRNGRVRFLRRQRAAGPLVTNDIIGLKRKYRTYGRFSGGFAAVRETGKSGNHWRGSRRYRARVHACMRLDIHPAALNDVSTEH